MTEDEDLAFQRYWYDRKTIADLYHQPMYVTPEEYKALKDWTFRLYGRDRRGMFVLGMEVGDYTGTEVVIDREKRDEQIGRRPVSTVEDGTAIMVCSACHASTSGPAGPTDEATRQREWWERHQCEMQKALW